MNGAVRGVPEMPLRIESAMLLCATIVAYAWTRQSWWLFGALFLAPDIGILAYSANPRVGAICCNAMHTSICAILLDGAGYLSASPVALSLAMIWLAHVGFDWMLGYGPKYATGFSDTHLRPLGQRRTIPGRLT